MRAEGRESGQRAGVGYHVPGQGERHVLVVPEGRGKDIQCKNFAHLKPPLNALLTCHLCELHKIRFGCSLSNEQFLHQNCAIRFQGKSSVHPHVIYQPRDTATQKYISLYGTKS